MKYIFLLFIAILSLIGAQCIVQKIVRCIFDKIRDSIPYIKDKTKNEEWYEKSDFEKESANLYFIDVKKEKLSFITKIISYLELITFALATFLLLNNLNNNSPILIDLVKFAGAWIAIKTIGSYNQWSGAIFGRAYFYTFFIGSILNIILAISIGYILVFLYK
jgi:hypothetical protein